MTEYVLSYLIVGAYALGHADGGGWRATTGVVKYTVRALFFFAWPAILAVGAWHTWGDKK